MTRYYGLNLRSAKQPQKPPLAVALAFGIHDDGIAINIETENALQASKAEKCPQKKLFVEDDPTTYDYDGCYDKMKEQVTRPLIQDRQERKPKYIQKLIQKAKERKLYSTITREKKLAKERSKDDHLYADKDKFVTKAFRKTLAEQEKFIRGLQPEEEDVTKNKNYLFDFYSSIGKNVAYGAKDAQRRKHGTPAKNIILVRPISEASIEEENSSVERQSALRPNPGHHKRSQDEEFAVKERFRARKRAKCSEHFQINA